MTATAKAKVITKDHGWDALMKTLSDASGGRFVQVGILGKGKTRDSDDPSPPTNLELGTIHEFGSSDGRVPERSFLRSTLDDNKKKYQDIIKKSLEKATKQIKQKKPIDWDKFFGRMGTIIVSDIQKKIKKGIAPELAPSTVEGRQKGKGGSDGRMIPLLDTHQLLGAITYAVKKGKQ